MKAAEVRVLKALEAGESYVEPAFVLVETAFDATGQPATTIDQLTRQVTNGRSHWHVATLGQSIALSHSAALEWAVSFAASRNIPVVYHRDETAGIAGYAAAFSQDGVAPELSASK